MRLTALVMTKDACVLQRAARPGWHRLLRAIGSKSKVILVALSIGVLGLTTTVSQAEPSMQQQLETLQHQLEQQQRVMEQQQQMMQQMQRQLDEQKMAGEQAMKHIKRAGKKIEQQAADAGSAAQQAESDAQQAEAEIRTVARVSGIDLSRESDRMGDSKGTNFRIPETDTVLTISGFIRGTAIHDFDQIASPTKFAARHIVVQDDPSGQPNNQTTFTANASRFVLGTATPTEKGKLSTFFSWDFDSNTTSSAADLRFRQAWGQLDGFLLGGDLRIGQAWTTWDDLGALPETMDFEGPNGSQQLRQPLIRWARDLDDEFTLWLAFEDPDYSVTDGGTQSGWPDAVASLNWHGDWGHLKPAIIGRQIRGDADAGGADTVIGWGTQLAGNIKVPLLAEKDNLKFQVVYGAGIGSYNNDGGFDDAMFTDNGNLKAINSFQGFGAFQHWWTDSLRSNAVFGWVNVDNRSGQADDSLDRTLYAAGNLVWSPLKQVDMGFEYLWGERRNKNDKSGTARRIQATTKFKF